MNRGVGLGVVVFVAGCSAPPKLVEPFPEPSRASGAWVVLDDRRPDWERRPFAGPVVSLHKLSRLNPSPWVRLQRAAEAVVAALPDKPERVDVVVTSLRLVSKEAAPAARTEEGGTVQVGGRNATELGTGKSGGYERVQYERVRSAQAVGDSDQVSQVLREMSEQNRGPTGVKVGNGPAVELPEGPLDDLAPGAHCHVRGVVRFTYPGGTEKDVPFAVLAARPNETQSPYWGETLDAAAQLAMLQFTRQLRAGVGLPVD